MLRSRVNFRLEERLIKLPSGSTDMGNVSYRAPAIPPLIARAPQWVAIHNPEFAHWAGSAEGDYAALDGAKALAMTVLDLLLNDGLRTAVREEFEG